MKKIPPLILTFLLIPILSWGWTVYQPTPVFSNGFTVTNGKVSFPVKQVSANYTAGDDYIIYANASAGAITISLPPAADNIGVVYTIKKVDNSLNVVTIDPNGSETIDGGLTYTISNPNEAITIQSDGSNWSII